MPAQIQATYTANYTDTQIGAFSEQALQAFDQLMSGSFDDFGVTIANASEPVKETIWEMFQVLSRVSADQETAASTSSTVPAPVFTRPVAARKVAIASVKRVRFH